MLGLVDECANDGRAYVCNGPDKDDVTEFTLGVRGCTEMFAVWGAGGAGAGVGIVAVSFEDRCWSGYCRESASLRIRSSCSRAFSCSAFASNLLA